MKMLPYIALSVLALWFCCSLPSMIGMAKGDWRALPFGVIGLALAIWIVVLGRKEVK